MKNYIILLCLLVSTFAHAESIKDNSFLIEEAYNQEAGVVQFINAYQYSDLNRDWLYTFTNEIPIHDETHQFSYTLPYLKKNDVTSEVGLGDILLNYRYQLVQQENLSIAPRLSVVLPTGDYKKNLGFGVAGLQFNQAVSIQINEKWVNHWNAGFAFTPNAKNSAGDTATVVGYNFGTSAIYAWTEKTNFLCEFVVSSSESVVGPSQKESSTSYLIVPGFRTAFQVGDTEVVPGLAATIGFGPSAVEHETGAFAYLSFESKLW